MLMRKHDLSKEIHRLGDLVMSGSQNPCTPRRWNKGEISVEIALIWLSRRRRKLLDRWGSRDTRRNPGLWRGQTRKILAVQRIDVAGRAVAEEIGKRGGAGREMGR